MLFHKKEKAPEGQQAGTKPEKPRKVRWSERREAGKVSGLSADLFHEQRPSDKNPVQFL